MHIYRRYFTVAPSVLIEDKYQRKVNAKAGTTLMLQAVITGFPEPQTTWSLNDQPVSATKDLSIENTHECSTLRVRGCSAKNTGVYVITAENEAGTATAMIDVSVTGKDCACVFN